MADVRNAAYPYFVPARAAPQAAALGDRNVYLAAALLYVLLLPPQLNLNIFDATFPPYRFFIILSTFYIFFSGLRGRFKLVLPDYLVIIATAWIWFSFHANLGYPGLIVPAGGQTIDIALSYFFARAAFQSPRDLRLFLLLIAPGLLAVSAVIVMESVLHKNLLQPIVAELVGRQATDPTHARLGLMRARGPMPHAILAGIFLASFLPLYWLSGLRGWPRTFGIIAACCSFFTVSSAALLALTLSAALLIYNWLSERIVNLSWHLFFIASGIFFFITELATESGTFNLVMRYAALNSSSSFNRVLIWRYGTENVKENPWFGIGYADWERPEWMVSSLDHYWLLQAIQVGIIPPTLIALVTILGIVALMRGSMQRGRDDKLALRSLAMAMSVFALGVISVSVWLSTQVWFHMMMGMCVSLGYAALSLNTARPAQVPAPSRRAPAHNANF